MRFDSNISHRTLLRLFNLGYWGLTWFSSVFWGIFVVLAVHYWFILTGTYGSYPDGALPDYANAATNIMIRIPVWVLGTFFGTLLSVELLTQENNWQKSLIVLANVFFYFFFSFVSVFVFSGSHLFMEYLALILFPAICLLAVGSKISLTQRVPNHFSFRDKVLVLTGLLLIIIPIVLSLFLLFTVYQNQEYIFG